MNHVSVTSKGQVTIPKHIRQKLGIQAGSQVTFRIVGDHAELEVLHSPTEASDSGFGLLTSRRKSVPADFDVASLVSDK
jgi:AbrB family looped-hinge helix DNA binding protein